MVPTLESSKADYMLLQSPFANRNRLIVDLIQKERLSYDEVARRMNVSRNVVASVCNRLGIKSQAMVRKKEEKAKNMKHALIFSSYYKQGRKSKSKQKSKKIKLSGIEWRGHLDPSISFEKLRKKQVPKGCRYIIGDPKFDLDWHYCQRTIEKREYCKKHHDRMFIKPVKKKKQKADSIE